MRVAGRTKVIRERFSFNEVRRALGGVLDHDLHAERIVCLCNATLAVCTIGQGLAIARDLNPKRSPIRASRSRCMPP